MEQTDAANPPKPASDVTTAGGNFFMDLISSPFRALSGLASGVLGSLWNGVKYMAIILGLRFLAAPIFAPVYSAIFGEDKLRKVNAGGFADVILDSAKLGLGAAAFVGGAGGVLDAASDSLGGKVGAGLLMTGAVVTLGALHKGEIKVADTNSPTAPLPTTPGTKPKSEQIKGQG